MGEHIDARCLIKSRLKTAWECVKQELACDVTSSGTASVLKAAENHRHMGGPAFFSFLFLTLEYLGQNILVHYSTFHHG